MTAPPPEAPTGAQWRAEAEAWAARLATTAGTAHEQQMWVAVRVALRAWEPPRDWDPREEMEETP